MVCRVPRTVDFGDPLPATLSLINAGGRPLTLALASEPAPGMTCSVLEVSNRPGAARRRKPLTPRPAAAP